MQVVVKGGVLNISYSWFFKVLKFCECLIFSFFTNALLVLIIFFEDLKTSRIYQHLQNSWNLSTSIKANYTLVTMYTSPDQSYTISDK